MRTPLSMNALALAVLLCIAVAPSAGSQDAPAAWRVSDLDAILRRPIVAPSVPQAEVERYAESRVPPVPTAKNASEWQGLADALRAEVLEKIVYRGEAAHWRDSKMGIVWSDVIDDAGPGYRIRKLRYEALPGWWIPALLYEPTKLDGKVPVVLNVNGHDGTGKAAPYKQIRCINQAKRGMIALNVEWIGMGQLRGPGYGHYLMNQLDLCGTSGLAPFYLSMARGLDILLAHEHADSERVAVAGLSGGGWQTITISSLDTRVPLSNPGAGYSSFKPRARHHSDLGDSEQTPNDLATIVDYTHLTAMLAPRAALLTFNAEDNCCFKASHAMGPLVDAAYPVYKLHDALDRVAVHVNVDPGTHNFDRDNREALYRSLRRHFADGDPAFETDEIASDGEVRKRPELDVELPADNAAFSKLASAFAADLPRLPPIPTDRDGVAKYVGELTRRLRAAIRPRRWDATSRTVGDAKLGATSVAYRELAVGGEWTLPAVDISPAAGPDGKRPRVAMVVADGGRASASRQIGALVAAGRRVLAIDPFYLGESKIRSRPYLFALLVATVGDRPAGIQASQVAAIARWAAEDAGEAVDVVAIGKSSTLFALMAAALERDAIAGVELHGSRGSLKEIIAEKKGVNQAIELCCFGLLRDLDIAQLVEIVAPRPVRFVKPSPGVRKAMAGLKKWYARSGVDLDPLPRAAR